MTTATKARTRHSQLVVDRLDDEWETLTRTPAPIGWAADTDLTGCRTLGEVFDRLTDDTSPTAIATGDRALFALLQAFQVNHDQTAGRIVLQRMLGRAVTLCRRSHDAAATGVRGSFADLLDLAVAAAWDAIATYPIDRRRTKVGVNLAMETLARFTSAVRLVDGSKSPDPVPDPQVTVPGPEEAVEAGQAPLQAALWGADAGIELLEVLAWGVDTGALTSDEAALVTRVYCPAPGQIGGSAVADEIGLAWATVRKRCSRAIRRLAAAVQAANYVDVA